MICQWIHCIHFKIKINKLFDKSICYWYENEQLFNKDLFTFYKNNYWTVTKQVLTTMENSAVEIDKSQISRLTQRFIFLYNYWNQKID